jgi:radical SAM protein with 4Fe4S-binding SPASM domain
MTFKKISNPDKKRQIKHGELARMLYKNGDPYTIIEKELGPAVVSYRNKWANVGKNVLCLKYPVHLNIELVYGCNLRCQFCILSSPKLNQFYKAKPADKIPFEKYCEIIDEGVKNGLCSVALNGYNEPLLQKDIVKHINYARDAGILDVTLHTNGLLLTEELSQMLVNSGLTIIMFSIDALTKTTYKKIRRSNEFDKLMHNITRFLEIKKESKRTLPLTRVSFVENKFNYMELEDFILFWQDRADFLAIQNFTHPFVGEQHSNKIKEEKLFENNIFSPCLEPYRRLMITCDGNVLPCCSYYAVNLALGNIYKDSIYNIWNSSKMQELRLKINGSKEKQPEACRKCRVAVTLK